MPPNEPHLSLVPESDDDFRVEVLAYKRLRALEDSSIRIARLAAMFDIHPVAFVELVEQVLKGRRTQHGRAIYLDLVRLLSGARKVRAEAWERAYGYCVREDHPFLRLVLLKMKAVRIPDLEQGTMNLDDLTLGERKSLARTGDERSLNRLMEDLDPRVVSQILLHPRMTEARVLKIASKRPMHPQSLVAILHHERWGTMTSVHEAVASNPWASTGLRAAIVPLLGPKAQSELNKASASAPAIRATIDFLRGNPEPLIALIER
jgi:hypothetical protein